MTSKRLSAAPAFLAFVTLFAGFDARQHACASPAGVVRSAPLAKAPNSSYVPKSAVAPLATLLKSHVHQRTVELPALSPDELEKIARQDSLSAEKRFRIGVGRGLSDSVLVNARTAPANSWTLLPDGSRVWTIHISSPGAIGLRAHLENVTLPGGARLIVYNPNSPDATTSLVPVEMPEDNSGVWTPTVFGEDMVIECQLAAGVEPAGVSFNVTSVSQRYRGIKAAPKLNAAACEHDVVCYFPQWEDASAGVACIDFVDGGDTYVCSGCLLNDSDPATDVVKKYFLTAHHCVGSKAVAATLEATWFYQASLCDNPSSVDNGIMTTGGADLLATSATSDFTFLKLRDDPPGGVSYEGWTTDVYSNGDGVTTIHHPNGLEKKISFGNEITADPDFWHVQWQPGKGVTEGGSSGSPLLNGDQLVTGQLWGGASDCSNPTGEDIYGRFDVTYSKIQKWIDNFAFLRVLGTYNGLLADSNAPSTQNSGFVTLTLRDQGAYSGNLQIAGKKYSISGQFDNSGVASNQVTRAGGTPLTVFLTLDVTPGAEALDGTVSDGATWTADLLAKRVAFNAKTNPPPFASKYTVVLPGADTNDAPRGFGFATIAVDKNGKAKLTGSLGDGTKLAQSVSIASDGTIPLYGNPYSGKGVLEGWLAFSTGSTDAPPAELSGPVAWVKDPDPKAKYYPAGFGLLVPAQGSIYASATPVIPIVSGAISFSGGNLPLDFGNDLTLSGGNKVLNQSTNKLSLSFVSSSGLFNGSVTPPSVKKSVPYHGIVLQTTGRGYGYFLGPTESGSVQLDPE